MRALAAAYASRSRIAIEVIGGDVQQHRRRAGGSVSTVSSWKLDTSTTQTPPGSAGRRPDRLGQRLAQVAADEGRAGRWRAASSPTSVVVVDLPLVPVMAISVRGDERDASSISPVIGDAGGARRRQLGDLGHARRQHDQVGAE